MGEGRFYPFWTCWPCCLGEKSISGGTLEFPVIKVASINGWDGGVVKRELKNLQWTTYQGPEKKGMFNQYEIVGQD